jgi:hypothetical protein
MPLYVVLNFLSSDFQMVVGTDIVGLAFELLLHPLKADLGAILESQGRGAKRLRLKFHCEFALLFGNADHVKVITSKIAAYLEADILYV